MSTRTESGSPNIGKASIQPPACKLTFDKYECEAVYQKIESNIVGRFSNPRIEHRFSAVISFWTMMEIWEYSGIGMDPYSLCIAKALWAKKDFESGKMERASMLANNFTAIRTFCDLMRGVKFNFLVDGKPVSFDKFEPVAISFPAETDTVFIKGFLK